MADRTALLTYVVRRCRHAQGLVSDPVERSRIERIFRHLTAWSAETRPGYVYGLARHHRPDEGTWLEAAQLAWDKLGIDVVEALGLGDLIAVLDAEPLDAERVRKLVLVLVDRQDVDQRHLMQVLAPHLDLLQGDRRLKRLKKRIRKTQTNLSKKGGARLALEVDWPGLEYTKGKRALMVGGDNRHEAQQRLQDALGFSEVHWDTGWEQRKTESLAERIRQGRYDLVLLIRRFVKHRTTDTIVPACKESKVPLVPVADGYGVEAVKRGVETTFDVGAGS